MVFFFKLFFYKEVKQNANMKAAFNPMRAVLVKDKGIIPDKKVLASLTFFNLKIMIALFSVLMMSS